MLRRKHSIHIFKPIHLLAVIALWLFAAFTPADREADNELLQQIYDEEMKEYRSWSLIPGSKPQVPGSGPHGDFITTYTNGAALQAIESNAESMPDGATIVKENFTADKEYRSTVLMKKMDGKWFWGVLKPYGQVRAAGFGSEGERMDTCQKCHNAAKRDGVFYWKNPR